MPDNFDTYLQKLREQPSTLQPQSQHPVEGDFPAIGTLGQPIGPVTGEETIKPSGGAFDVLGSAAWQALDTIGFGVPGLVFDNKYEDWENLSSAAKVAGVIGGAASFLVPMGWIGKASKAAMGLSKVSSKGAARVATETAGKLLAKEAKVTTEIAESVISKAFHVPLEGVKGVKQFSPSKYMNAFERSVDDIAQAERRITEMIKPSINKGILETSGVQVSEKGLSQITDSFVGALREGKHLNTAGAWMESVVGVKLGSSGGQKIAAYAGRAVDNAINFGIYNSLTELTASKTEGRAYNVGNPAYSTFMFSALLPFVETIGGGSSQGILKTGKDLFKRIRNKQDYSKLSMLELETYVKSALKFDNKAFGISTELKIPGKLSTLVDNKLLSSTGKNFYSKDQLVSWLDDWHTISSSSLTEKFIQESLRDLGGSSWRMAAGAMFFNAEYLMHPQLLDDADPYEVATHMLTGAFFTKKHKPFGKTAKTMPGFRDEYQKLFDAVHMMGYKPTELNFINNMVERSTLLNPEGLALREHPMGKAIYDALNESVDGVRKGKAPTIETIGVEEKITQIWNPYRAMKLVDDYTNGTKESIAGLNNSVLARIPRAKRMEIIESLERMEIGDGKTLGEYEGRSGRTGIDAYMREVVNPQLRENTYEGLMNVIREGANVLGVKITDMPGKQIPYIERIVDTRQAPVGAIGEWKGMVEKMISHNRLRYQDTLEPGLSITDAQAKLAQERKVSAKTINVEMREKLGEVLAIERENWVKKILGPEAKVSEDSWRWDESQVWDALRGAERENQFDRWIDIASNNPRVDSDASISSAINSVFNTSKGISDKFGGDNVGYRFKYTEGSDSTSRPKSNRVSEKDFKEMQNPRLDEIHNGVSAMDEVIADMNFIHGMLASSGKVAINHGAKVQTIDIADAKTLSYILRESGLMTELIQRDGGFELKKYMMGEAVVQDSESGIDVNIAQYAVAHNVGIENEVGAGAWGIKMPNANRVREVLEFKEGLTNAEAKAKASEYGIILDRMTQRMGPYVTVEDFIPKSYVENMDKTPDYLSFIEKAGRSLPEYFEIGVRPVINDITNSLDVTEHAEAIKSIEQFGRDVKENFNIDPVRIKETLEQLDGLITSNKFSPEEVKAFQKVSDIITKANERTIKQLELLRKDDVSLQTEKEIAGIFGTGSEIKDINQVLQAVFQEQGNSLDYRADIGRVMNNFIYAADNNHRGKVGEVLHNLMKDFYGVTESEKGSITFEDLKNDVEKRGYLGIKDLHRLTKAAEVGFHSTMSAKQLENMQTQSLNTYKELIGKVTESDFTVSLNSIAQKYDVFYNLTDKNFSDIIRTRIRSAYEDAPNRQKGIDKMGAELVDTVRKRHGALVAANFVNSGELFKILQTSITSHKPTTFQVDLSSSKASMILKDNEWRAFGASDKFVSKLHDDYGLDVYFISRDGRSPEGKIVETSRMKYLDDLMMNAKVSLEISPAELKLLREFHWRALKVTQSGKYKEQLKGTHSWQRLVVHDGGSDMLVDNMTFTPKVEAKLLKDFKALYDSKINNDNRANLEKHFKAIIDKGEGLLPSEKNAILRFMYYDATNRAGQDKTFLAKTDAEYNAGRDALYKYGTISEASNSPKYNGEIIKTVFELSKDNYTEREQKAFTNFFDSGFKWQTGVINDTGTRKVHDVNEGVNSELSIMSIRGNSTRDYKNRISKLNKTEDALEIAALERMIEMVNSEEFHHAKGSSVVDGAGYLGTDAMTVLLGVNGVKIGDGHSGFKPVIHMNNADGTLIGKLNFFYDPKMAEIIDNSGMKILLTGTAAKSFSGNMYEALPLKEGQSYHDNIKETIGDGKIGLSLPIEDIGLTYLNKPAKRGRNVSLITNWMTGLESAEFTNYMGMKQSVEEISGLVSQLGGPGRAGILSGMLKQSELEGHALQHSNQGMLFKMIEYGLDSQDLIVKNQVTKMMYKTMTQSLGKPLTSTAGKSVMIPGLERTSPVYGKFSDGAGPGAETHLYQMQYGGIKLPFDAGLKENSGFETKHILFQSAEQVPIVFRVDGVDVIRMQGTVGEKFYDPRQIVKKKGGAGVADRAMIGNNEAIATMDFVQKTIQENITRWNYKDIYDFFEGVKSERVKDVLSNKANAEHFKNIKKFKFGMVDVDFRIPRQEPGFGINRVEGFYEKEYGNVASVSPLEVATRHQGDHDVDKLDWHARPHDSMMQIAVRNAGVVTDTFPFEVTEGHADIYNTGDVMSKAGSIAKDGLSEHKDILAKNRMNIGRIVRAHTGLTLMKSLGIKINEQGFEQLYDRKFDGFYQRMSNITSSVFDPLKGYSQLAKLDGNQILDFVLFNELPAGVQVKGGQPKNTWYPPLDATSKVQKESFKIVLDVLNKPQRLFGGVFDEAGQRMPEFNELYGMRNDISDFLKDPNVYVFKTLMNRFYDNSTMKSEILTMFAGAESQKDKSFILQDIKDGKLDYASLVSPNNKQGISSVRTFDEAATINPAISALKHLTESAFTRTGTDFEISGMKTSGEYKASAKGFIDLVNLYSVFNNGLTPQRQELADIWLNGIEKKIGAREPAQQRQHKDMVWQVISKDIQKAESTLNWLAGEKFANTSKINSAINELVRLKSMQDYFRNDALVRMGKDLGKKAGIEDGWEKVKIFSTGEKGQWIRPVEYGRQMMYKINPAYQHLKLSSNMPFEMLQNGTPITTDRGIWLSPNTRYIRLDKPLTERRLDTTEMMDGYSAMLASQTLTPETFRTQLPFHEVDYFYKSLTNVVNDIRTVNKRRMEALSEYKLDTDRVFATSAHAVDSKINEFVNEWLMPEKFAGNREQNISKEMYDNRVADLLDVLMMPTPINNGVLKVGGQEYPALRADTRVSVPVIEYWRNRADTEGGEGFHTSLKDWALRKGTIYQAMKGEVKLNDGFFHSELYREGQGVKNYEYLGEWSNIISDMVNTPRKNMYMYPVAEALLDNHAGAYLYKRAMPDVQKTTLVEGGHILYQMFRPLSDGSVKRSEPLGTFEKRMKEKAIWCY